MNYNTELFNTAKNYLVGGVNSPVRAFTQVGGNPIFVSKAEGAYIYDANGKRYIDCIASWGPMILGHAHKSITDAIAQQVQLGTSYGIPTSIEISMAKLIQSVVPNMELMRMVNSGTEACMSAVRLARGYTQKSKIIKLEGCYHGHADSFLVKAGSGVATLGIKNVNGVTLGVMQDTLVAPYNDIDAIEQLFRTYKDEIACIILEPVAGNMGCILPKENYLKQIRILCDENNSLLIFDEVMTGFRLSVGGAQSLYNVKADLVTFGKIIGAGLPVGCFGGKKEIMQHLAPLGSVYQAGTLSGNPLAMQAGIALITLLKENPSIYKELEEKTNYLANGLHKAFEAAKEPVCINHIGSMISVHFTDKPVNNFTDASICDLEKFKKYFHFLLDAGVYLPPSPYESWFLNNAMSYSDMDKIIEATQLFLTS